MEKTTLQKFFPFSFTEKKDVVTLVIVVLVHIGAGAVIGWLTGILSHIPLLGILIGIVGGLLGFYVLVGIILAVLDYLKVLK